MTDDDPTLAGLADQPLDDLDAAALDRVRALYEALDPVPPDLVSRIGFSLALDELSDEVARMTRVPLDALATRSDRAAGTRTETLTFSADRLTAMVTVQRRPGGRLRLDGWLAPPEPCLVRLRLPAGADRETLADAQGRFSFDSLPEGFGQLSFHPGPDAAPAEGGETTVVTPLFQL